MALYRKFTSLLLLILVLMTGCGQGQAVEGERLRTIEKTKLIRVATESVYPPMEFMDEAGKVVGFDMDLMAAIAQALGWKLEIITTDFAGITEGLGANRYDAIIAGMTITDERKEKVLFSEPYIDAVGLSLVVAADEPKLAGFDDIRGKIIGVQQGSSAESYALNDPSIKEVKMYPTNAEAMLDLWAKRVDGVILDNVVGAYYMKQNASRYKLLPEIEEAGPIGIAIPIDSPELKAKIDGVLKAMKADGRLDKIAEKWFGHDLNP